jgi:GNAT superfamily N-acetyltransferase
MPVREAKGQDFPGVMRLYRQLQPDDPVLTDGRDEAAFHRILETPGLTIFVLESDSRIVATCYLNVIPNITRSARPYAIIENVVTDEDLRGQGCGKLVLEHALSAAWAEGCYKAMLQTGSKRESTHSFYRSCGFSADDKTGYVARPA